MSEIGGITRGIFGGRSSLLFFFLLLVIIFLNCKCWGTDPSNLLFFFLLLIVLIGGQGLFGFTL